MKLLLRRDQKKGMLSSKITFLLDIRAELTDQEKANIAKYKFSEVVLYARDEHEKKDTTMGMVSAALKFRLLNITIRVSDLENGKQIECKDIIEMLAVEEQVKEAAQTFKTVLEAAANFGGEQVLEVA